METHVRVKAQEKGLARKLGGYRQPASGNSTIIQKKGDVKTRCYRVECKSTVNNSFSIKKEYLDKITNEAMFCNQDPVLEFEFVNSSNTSISKWVIIPLTLFEELMEK